jgi:hypothetical protein
MKQLYAYFVLNCQAFYIKSGRNGPLESALFCVTFVFAQFLISMSVVASKIMGTSSGKFIFLSIVTAYLFHLVQKKTINASFLSHFRKKFRSIESVESIRNAIVMILPSTVLAIGLLIVMIALNRRG